MVSHGMQDVLWKLMSQPRRPGRSAGVGQGQRRRASSRRLRRGKHLLHASCFYLPPPLGGGWARTATVDRISSGHRTQHKAYPEANAHLD